MQCMKFKTSFWQNPSQKFSKNFIDFEKSQNFPKIQKLGQTYEMNDEERDYDLTSEEKQD